MHFILHIVKILRIVSHTSPLMVSDFFFIPNATDTFPYVISTIYILVIVRVSHLQCVFLAHFTRTQHHRPQG